MKQLYIYLLITPDHNNLIHISIAVVQMRPKSAVPGDAKPKYYMSFFPVIFLFHVWSDTHTYIFAAPLSHG